MVNPVDRLLDRLEKVRGRNGQYMARCPAHDDRGPSLSIGEGDQGSVLVHCFAGCSTEAVVNAVGLELSDLFVSDPRYYELRRLERRPQVDYKALCFLLRREVYVLSAAASQLERGQPFSDDDWKRLGRMMKNFERLEHVR